MTDHDQIRADRELVRQIPLFAIDEAAAEGFGAEFTLDQHLAFQRVIDAIPELLSELAESERNLDLVRDGYGQVLADNAQLEQRITSALAAYEERTFQWETERARVEAAEQALASSEAVVERIVQLCNAELPHSAGWFAEKILDALRAVSGGESAEPGLDPRPCYYCGAENMGTRRRSAELSVTTSHEQGVSEK